MANPHTVCFYVTGICTIQVIIFVPGETPDTCSETVDVLPHSYTTVEETVCEGDSVEINGSYYTAGIYTDTIFGGSSAGCDSILVITINSNTTDTMYVSYLGCQGDGFSVVVNNNTYDEANPAGQELFTGVDGCDSLMIINLIYQPHTTGNEIYFGCSGDGYFVIVNGTTYDESNPTGMEVFMAANGCDSVITISLTYFPPHLIMNTYQGCSGDGYSNMVGTSIYDEANPSGIGSTPRQYTPNEIRIWYDPLHHSIILDGVEKELNVQLVDIQGREIFYSDKEFVDEDLMKVTLSDYIPSLLFVSVYSDRYRFTRGVFVRGE